jgi:cytidylate kinase
MRTTTIKFLRQVILALARHGEMVIVGRGAFAVLGGFADVLNVRIQAPFPIRVRQVMEKEKIKESDRAEALLKERDSMRDAFVKSFYDIRWEDTSKVPPDLAVTWLVEALKVLKERKEEDRPNTNTIEINTALANTVSEVLGCQVTH